MADLSQDSQCLGRDSNGAYLEHPVFETALKFVTLHVIIIFFIQMNAYVNIYIFRTIPIIFFKFPHTHSLIELSLS
jgi:phage FluMu gp28-like protein